MMEPPVPRREPHVFWLQHVWLGIGMSFTVIGVIALYLLVTPRPHATSVLWGAVVIAVVLTSAVTCLPWRRIVASGSAERLLVAWSVALVPLIVLLAALDGGTQSPMAALLVLPLVFAAMAYPVRATIGVGIATIVGQAMIGVSSSGALGETVVQVTILILIAAMGALIARNHERTLAATEELADRLQQLTRVDSLTGCLNHRGFHERLEEEAAADRRAGRPLTLLHLDLDHFKVINDTYGHPTGDEVLLAVGATLRGHVDPTAAVGRLGGEEFAVLVPAADHVVGAEIAERIRTAIREQVGPPPVTVSIGVSTLPASAHRLDHLVRTADEALYRAKAAGRDQVVVADRAPIATGRHTRGATAHAAP